MLKIITFITIFSIAQLSCASNSESVSSVRYNDIMKFSYANCLFQYFKSEGIDTTDIRNISGGIVEKSSIPLDLFQDISISISNYSPIIKTKNNINIKLYKCFHLEGNADLQKIINR